MRCQCYHHLRFSAFGRSLGLSWACAPSWVAAESTARCYLRSTFGWLVASGRAAWLLVRGYSSFRCELPARAVVATSMAPYKASLCRTVRGGGFRGLTDVPMTAVSLRLRLSLMCVLPPVPTVTVPLVTCCAIHLTTAPRCSRRRPCRLRSRAVGRVP